MNTADPIVIEKFKNLPQKLKDVLFSDDTTSAVFEVGKTNGLAVFQMEELADETGLIILGITKIEDYEKNVLRRIKIDPVVISTIVKILTAKIIDPIRGDLSVLQSPPTKPEAVILQSPPPPSEPATMQTVKNIITPKSAPETIVVSKPPEPQTQVFAKQPQDPYREQVNNLNIKQPAATQPRITTWEDILKNKNKEPESHPDAKVALEKALDDTAVPTKIPTTSAPQYTGNDPYRESLE